MYPTRLRLGGGCRLAITSPNPRVERHLSSAPRPVCVIEVRHRRGSGARRFRHGCRPGAVARGRGRARLRVSLNVEEGPRLWRDRRGPLANAGVDRSCATTVGGSDAAGRGRPVAGGGDALPGVRWASWARGAAIGGGCGSAARGSGCWSGGRAARRASARTRCCRGFCWRAGWMWSTRSGARSGWRPRVVGIARSRRRWGVPCSTVRAWLRRLRARADVLRGWFVGAGGRDGGAAGAAAARGRRRLGLLVRAIADAFLAARLRLGPGAVTGGVWAFCSAATTGRAVGQHERALGTRVEGRAGCRA